MPIIETEISLEQIEKIEENYIKFLDKEQEIWRQLRVASPRLNRMLEKVQLTIIKLEEEYESLTSRELCKIVEDAK